MNFVVVVVRANLDAHHQHSACGVAAAAADRDELWPG